MLMLIARAASAWPDLKVEQISPAQAVAGGLVSYTLTYSNSGPVNGVNVVLKDFLPAYVTVVTNTLSGGTLASNTISWNLGTVGSRTGGTKSFQVRISTNIPTSAITNRAQIFGSEAEEAGKTNDNSSTRITQVTTFPPPCPSSSFSFDGNTALFGTAGNLRTFTTNGIAVNVSAFSRVKSSGSWATAYLGLYGGGFGVTDGSEGDGSNNAHAVDNIGRDNYLLFEFSQPVILNRANLGYVVSDSDLRIWIGSFADPFNRHLTLSDAVLSGFGYTETNLTDSAATRSALLNAGGVVGNALIIAALPGDSAPNDQFKISLLEVCQLRNQAPVAFNQSLTGIEDTVLPILLTSSDPDGPVTNFTIVTLPTRGTLTGSGANRTYTPASNYFGPDSFTFTVNDGSLTSAVATVSINLTPVNDPPVANGQSVNALEDAATPITLTATDPEGNALTYVIVGQPTNGTLAGSGPAFLYRPFTNYNGPDRFTFKVNDGAVDSATANVSIAVTPVNDPPSFARGPDQMVMVNAGAQTVPNWASNVSPGPADEAGQAVNFVVTTDNNALFSVLPAISRAGTLTYTLATNAFGTANVSVAARDNGGTANGGQDTSAPITFSIGGNAPPFVTIVTPPSNSVYFPFQLIPYTAVANDSDGTVAKVQLFVGTNVVSTFTNAPYTTTLSNLAPGPHQLTARAVDNLGAASTSSVVNITVLASPPIVLGPREYNFQVTLAEQKISVVNPTPYALTAVRVLVSNLRSGVRVHNASGTNSAGIAYVQYNQAIPPFTTVDLTIEYFTPLVQAVTASLLAEVVPLAPPPRPFPPGTTLVPTKRLSTASDGRMLVSFDSVPGQLYYIEYSDDLVVWKPSYPPVTALGVVSQWVDNGWPKTENHPASVKKRFYHVLLGPIP